MSEYGTITVRGEVLNVTKRGRVLLDCLAVSGCVLFVWVFGVVVAVLD